MKQAPILVGAAAPHEPSASHAPDNVDHFQSLASVAQVLIGDDLFVRSVTSIVEDLNAKQNLFTEAVAWHLCKLLLKVTDADVAWACTPAESEYLRRLGSPVWAGDEVGSVPSKLPRNRGKCVWGTTSSSDTTLDNWAVGSVDYSEKELDFIRSLRSESQLPVKVGDTTLAVICLGKRASGHFHEARIAALTPLQSFVSAFYQLAQLTDEKLVKTDLIQRVATVLPSIAGAQRIQGFGERSARC